MQVDAVAHAYALLGLRRGCSRRDVKQQYKRLVRKWHPDQYANDPVGYAEANAQLRRINEAFAVLEASVSDGNVMQQPVASVPEPPPEREPPTYFGKPLTPAEIDRIAKAIGTPDSFGYSFRLASWLFPLVVPLVFLASQQSKPLTWLDIAACVSSIGFAIVVIARQRWTRQQVADVIRRALLWRR